MSDKIKKGFSILGQSLLISGIVILLVCPFSCKLTAEGIDVIKGDYESPEMNQCIVIDENHVALDFSENVTVHSVSVSKGAAPSLFFDNSSTDSSLNNFPDENYHVTVNGTNTDKVTVELDKNTEIGVSYVISGVVEDCSGNSLTFAAPFSGYNGNIPKMIITEVHPEYSKVGQTNIYRCEYVELLALEDGNLYGLVLGSATNGEDLDYRLPAISVKKGEIIVVHLRVKGDGCISEDSDNISLATSEYCLNNVRDLWLNNQGSALSDDYDVVYLYDSIKNEFCDGMMYINKEKKDKWSEEILSKINELVDSGIFLSNDVSDACDEDDVTPTKAFIRTNVKEIISKADSCIADGTEILIPAFSKDNWIVDYSEAGKI